jgi:hypothetical protein
MTDDDYKRMWGELSGAAKDVLICLCKHGPTWDGDVPSKHGRDELVSKGLAVRMVMGDHWVCPKDWKKPRPQCEYGFQAATYRGAYVYKQGYVEPRKDIVRNLVGKEWVRP